MDEKDRMIVSILQKNGKATLAEIAKQVGMSAMGVKKRLDKLEDGKIKLKPLLNVEELGVIAVLTMEIEGS